MNLIDKDKLIKELLKIKWDYIEDNFFWVKMMNVIDNVQSVKYIPNDKTAEWQFISENYFEVTYSCTKCGRFFTMPKGKYNEAVKLAPYCHCGAKMIKTRYKNEIN